ncbi:hypothetical protein [Pseudalkalibacillus sp. NRS-1564]|uniref:hypothetical protein n=1 Tax=Pseudalkalibacillus sp. NRS-1564 TaxID=3233900 RepID=UPI003D28F4CA
MLLKRGKRQLMIIVLMIGCCVPVVGFSQALQDNVAAKENTEPVVVNHRVKDHNVFIECLIPNFSFDKENTEKEYHGHLNVYLDGVKHQTVERAAFVIRNLPEGKHTIRLDIMREDGGRYLSLKEMKVEIK